MSKYRLSHTFEFRVALSWSGVPYASRPTAYLGSEGETVSDEAQAALFVFRLFPTGRDDIAIQERLDEINGGIEKTVDLETAILALSQSLRESYEAYLWPEGRPKAEGEEAKAQEEEMQRAWLSNVLDDKKDKDVLARMQQLEERQKHTAEWSVLAQSVPPAFADLADAPLPRNIREAILAHYRRAKLEAESKLGK